MDVNAEVIPLSGALWQVWTVILISMLVMGPLIWGIIRFRVWLAPGDAHLNRIIPLTSCVWFVYGGLMKQGTTLQPTTGERRCWPAANHVRGGMRSANHSRDVQGSADHVLVPMLIGQSRVRYPGSADHMSRGKPITF